MKILITGGAGFIGSHVFDVYNKAGHLVSVIDNLSSGKLENLPKDVQLFEGSIEDVDFVARVIEEFKPDVVNHHAAQISVVHSVNNPREDANRNILGTINILEAIRLSTHKVKKLIYATSGGAMYGPCEGVENPHTEEVDAVPVSPYGLSKYVAERYVWLYASLYGLNATVLRYSNVYGPRQDPHGEAGVCAIFSQNMLDAKPVSIFGDGSQVRDYIFVGDVVAANLAVLEKGDGQFFNICTGADISTLNVFDTIKKAANYQLDPIMAEGRLGEVQTVVLSFAKAKKVLGWQPQVDFKEGITRTIDWYRQN